MEVLFKTHFWIIKLLGASAALAFFASAVVTHFSSSMLMDDATLASVEENAAKKQVDAGGGGPGDLSPGGQPRASRIDKRGVGEQITVARPFCPTCGPVEDDPLAADSEGEAAVDPSAGPVPCRLPLQLLATMEADNPRYSMAIISNTETEVSGAFRVDDEVENEVVVVEVRRSRVILRNRARLEYLDLVGQPGPKAGPSDNAKPTRPVAPPKPVRSKRRNSRVIEGAAEAINCTGDSCVVDRAFRDKLISNPSLLAKQARVIPAVKDGESRGFKFYGIRSGSLPKLLGMRNGDMLTSVNGIELKNVDQVLGLYTKLRRASHLSVTYERKNKAYTKEIIFR